MKRIVLFVAHIFVVVISINAQNWTQIGSTINGLDNNSGFGREISLNSTGTIVAVAAAFKTVNSHTEAGQVRVFKNISGAWTQIGQNLNGASAYDHFGSSLSLNSNGDILAIGITNPHAGGIYGGVVKVFRYASGSWTQIGNDIIRENSTDFFGDSVGLSSDGHMLAVGAPEASNSKGYVKIYHYNGNDWTQQGQKISGDSDGDYFGKKIDMDATGNKVVVGAPSAGYVKVYRNVSGTWTQLGVTFSGNVNDGFGSAVSISGNGSRVAIGAWANEDGGGAWNGQIKVFESNNGSWQQIGGNINGNSCDNLGASVSLNAGGNILAAGAPFSCPTRDVRRLVISSAVKVYEENSGSWTQIGNNISGNTDRFGTSVDISSSGSIVAGGTPNGRNIHGEVQMFLSPNASNIDQVTSSDFKIFPNPVENIIQIESQSLCRIQQISISDISGKTVLKKILSKPVNQIVLSEIDLLSGIYFLHIQTNRNTYIRKIIKK